VERKNSKPPQEGKVQKEKERLCRGRTGKLGKKGKIGDEVTSGIDYLAGNDKKQTPDVTGIGWDQKLAMNLLEGRFSAKKLQCPMKGEESNERGSPRGGKSDVFPQHWRERKGQRVSDL